MTEKEKKEQEKDQLAQDFFTAFPDASKSNSESTNHRTNTNQSVEVSEQSKKSKPTNTQQVHHEEKHSTKKTTPKKNHFAFGVQHKKHPIQYGNLRVNIKIVRQLKLLQLALGLRSRSALLKQMVDFCKPEILSNPKVKKAYKKFHKSMKNNLEAKQLNK